MDDLISRQAAIDALGERPDVWTDSEGELAEARQWEYDVAAIKAVPSAQPELIEHNAYIRGFEQGRIQGMIDTRGEKNMIKVEWTNADALNLQPTCNQLATDCINRQTAIDAFDGTKVDEIDCTEYDIGYNDGIDFAVSKLSVLPSAQSERDIPMQPNETIDSSWGIRKKQAICPKCNYYLNRIYFLGDSKNKKITYCETCGQAINWEGWEWEEE